MCKYCEQERGKSKLIASGNDIMVRIAADEKGRVFIYGSAEDETERIYPQFCPFCGRKLTGMCKCCGKHPAEVKGMCRTCYSREYARKRAGDHKPGDNWNEQSKAIAADYKAGMKQSEIARKHNVSRQWVSVVVKKVQKNISENG